MSLVNVKESFCFEVFMLLRIFSEYLEESKIVSASEKTGVHSQSVDLLKS